MAANKPAPDPKEAQYNELIDYSHYIVVNDLRSKYENHEDSDTEEELFSIAHFMLRHAAWDPYKQSLLAVSLIEKTGEDAADYWDKILTPLEKAYQNSSGQIFKDKFGYDYRTTRSQSGEDNVAATRQHSILILSTLSTLMKEAGQLQDLPEEQKRKGVLTPLQRAEREAKRKVVAAKVEAARKAQAEAEMAALEASEKE